MSDMLKTGLAYLTKALKEFASETVTYSRGYESVDVQATFGEKLLKLDDGFGGIRMEWTDCDFAIPVADLFFTPGVPIIPQRGDLIHVSVGAYDVNTFEVFPFGLEPTHRLIHRDSMWRIHTKRIDTGQFY